MAKSSREMRSKLGTDLNDTEARAQSSNLRDHQTELRLQSDHRPFDVSLSTGFPHDTEETELALIEEGDHDSANAAVYSELLPPTAVTSPAITNKKKKVKTSTREKLRLVLAWAWFILSGFDYRKVETQAVPEKTRKEKIFNVLTNIITTVVSVSTGLITTIAVAAMYSAAFPALLAVFWAGYRVNFAVYKEAIANTFKSLFIDGVFHPEIDVLLTSELPDEGKFEELPGKSQCAYVITGNKLFFIDKQRGQRTQINISAEELENLKKQLKIDGQNLTPNEKSKCLIEQLKPNDLKTIKSKTSHTPISLLKKILIIGGLSFSVSAGAAISTISYLSVATTVGHIFLFVGLAGAAAFPPVIIPIAGIIAAVTFCAMAALMFNSISNAIKQDAHLKVINFCRTIFNRDPKISKTQHVIESASKIFFIVGGVLLAIVATITVVTVWNNSMVTILSKIPDAHIMACKIVSAVLTFGFTMAARTPLVIEKAVKVFGLFGTLCGTGLYKLGHAITHPKDTYHNLAIQTNTLKNYIHKKCTDDDTHSKFDLLRTTKFIGSTLLTGLLAITAVACIGFAIIANAFANGILSVDGGKVLTDILSFFHINLSPSAQNVTPFLSGSIVSVTFGADGFGRTINIPNDGTAPSEQVDDPASPHKSIPRPLSSPAQMVSALNGHAPASKNIDVKKVAQETLGGSKTFYERTSDGKAQSTKKTQDKQPLLDDPETSTEKSQQSPTASSWLGKKIGSFGSMISELASSLSKALSNEATTAAGEYVPLKDVTSFGSDKTSMSHLTAVI